VTSDLTPLDRLDALEREATVLFVELNDLSLRITDERLDTIYDRLREIQREVSNHLRALIDVGKLAERHECHIYAGPGLTHGDYDCQMCAAIAPLLEIK